jgi:ribosome maturation factor RimP
MVNDEMRAAIEDCTARLSAHLIELVVRGPRGKTLVEIFIDAEQGVTSDLCSDVSREASILIDRSEWIQGSYRLDVSSPGISRPLRFAWQYKKHVGRTLAVKVLAPGGTVFHPWERTGSCSKLRRGQYRRSFHSRDWLKPSCCPRGDPHMG